MAPDRVDNGATADLVEVPMVSPAGRRLALVAAAVALLVAGLAGPSVLAGADGTAGPVTDSGDAVVLGADRIPEISGIEPVGRARDTTPEEIGAHVLATFPVDVDALLPGWTVRFTGPHDGLLGGTAWANETITIWIRPNQSIEHVRYIFAHEVGHALDIEYLSSEEHAAWRSLRGFREDEPWWPESAENDYSTPAGDWAEVYAVWASSSDFFAGTHEPPAAEDLAVVEAFHARLTER